MPGQGLQPETLSVVPGVYGNPQRSVAVSYTHLDVYKRQSGYYEVQITGEKLKNTSVVLYDSNSGRALPLENVVQEDDEMRASFSLRGGLDTLRVNILNEGSEPIAINEVNLMSAY